MSNIETTTQATPVPQVAPTAASGQAAAPVTPAESSGFEEWIKGFAKYDTMLVSIIVVLCVKARS
jgi:hypothetical protein